MCASAAQVIAACASVSSISSAASSSRSAARPGRQRACRAPTSAAASGWGSPSRRAIATASSAVARTSASGTWAAKLRWTAIRARTCARIGESSVGQPAQGLLQQRDVLGVLDAVLLPRAAGVPERGAGEGRRVAGGAGGDRGAGEAGARRLPLAGVRLGGGQRVLQPGELGPVGVLVAPPQPRRCVEQPDRLVVGEPGGGLRGGALGVRDGAVGRPRPGGAEMPRQLGEPGVGPRAMELLDRLADPQMQPRPPGRRQLGLERRAQQRVGERVAPGRARDLGQQRAAHRGVEHVEQLVLGEAGDALEQLEVEVAADQGGDAEHAAGVLGQPADPGRDDVAHALGHARVGDPRAVELRQMARELLDEERVAAGLRVDRGDGAGRRVAADQLGDLPLVHAVEAQPRQLAPALQLGEQLRQRVARLQLGVAERAHHQDRARAAAPGRGGGRAAATSGRPSAGRRRSSAPGPARRAGARPPRRRRTSGGGASRARPPAAGRRGPAGARGSRAAAWPARGRP